MPRIKISIQERSPIIQGAKSQYFTITTPEGKTYVSWELGLHEHCGIGEIDAEVAPPYKADGNEVLKNIWKDGNPIIKPQEKGTGRSYGKSKEELAQQRQLAETQNRSIQAQTALNRAVEIHIALLASGNGLTSKELDDLTKHFYQLLQELTQISEAKVIYQKIKGETEYAVKTVQKAQPTSDTGQLSGEAADEGSREDKLERIKAYYIMKGWWIDSKRWVSPQVYGHLKEVTGKPDINKLSDEELDKVLEAIEKTQP